MLGRLGLFDIAHWIWSFLDSTAFQSLVVIGGVWVAYRGLDTWQKQHLWTRNAELAEEILVAATDLKGAIAKVRNPFGFAGEGESRQRGPNETDADRRALDVLFQPLERLKNEQRIVDRFAKADVRCRLRFGVSIASHLDAITKLYGEVVVAAQMKFTVGKGFLHRSMSDADQASQNIRDRILYYSAVDDKIAAGLDAATAGLDLVLSRYIREDEGKKKG